MALNILIVPVVTIVIMNLNKLVKKVPNTRYKMYAMMKAMYIC